MKSVYHKKYFSLNDAGNDIDRMTTNVVKPIFDFWLGEGYSPREISQVMQCSINMLELESVLSIGVKEHKKDKGRHGGNR